MTGRFEHPDLDMKMDAVRSWLCWCAEVKVAWLDQSDGGRVREANTVWGMLRPRRIVAQGVDEVRYIDVPSNVENPRQEMIVGWRAITFDFRTHSRDQNHRQSAWYAATRAQLRARYRYGKDKWLKPFDMSLATIEDVVNMPEVKEWDDRVEDVANMEFTLNTFLCDKDASAVGTWIEQVVMNGDLLGMAGSIQIREAEMGLGDSVYIVENSEDETALTVDGDIIVEGS